MSSKTQVPERNESRSAAATLYRLIPFVKPDILLVGLALLSATAATLCGLLIPLVIQWIIDGPVARGDLLELLWASVGILLLGALEALFFLGRHRLVIGPSARMESRMRSALFDHLQRLPLIFHDRWHSGQLLSRAVSDISTIVRFPRYALVYLVVNSFTIAASLVVLCWMSPLLGLVFAVISVPVAIGSTLFESRYKAQSLRAQNQLGDLTTQVEESVLGIRVLKAFGRSAQATAAFRRQAELLRNTEIGKVRLLGVLTATIVGLPEIALGAVLAVGGFLAAQGTLSAGELVAAVAVVAYLQWPLESIGYLLAEANSAAAAAQRYFQLLDAPVTIVDPPRPQHLPTPLRGHLRLEKVSFRFPGAAEDLLTEVDLEIRPGETLALVGAAGSGKSLLVGLITRLYDVTGGRITLDGVDITQVPLAELREAVATVFEDPVLFSGSVADNVRLDREQLTDEQVDEALRVANADSFVAAMPSGARTEVGEQGFSLSGGQRQRLALARAVVGRPSLLVMDDPLSALDVHTEAEVEAALRQVLRGTTALIVAHRPSTVQLASRVALLSGGRITAVGSHHELLRTSPEYWALMSSSDEQTFQTEAATS
ncbi:ABC transporter ATP-binding protein [Saccharopolyspora hirsuta]|uniref:ABC transporter ATP-binding protein n=1 Tax=Saccharopolyspora hirsuta TaxID=1837 RepID=A0A5M7C631_SACHI|nr:ABC transporter ATP-binding protein [Saccharopolyspora hirsuta]KAA5835064.1 ABC transporter ATP-binding protein [Saccharopolyspora hirsuta]